MSISNRGENSILSFIALCLLLYFVGLPLVLAILMGYFGSVSAAVTGIVDLIPFGRVWIRAAVSILNGIGGFVTNYSVVHEPITVPYILKELTKGLFTVVIFEGLNFFMIRLLGLADGGGIWNKAKKVVITVADAMLAACVAPLPLAYVLSHLDNLGVVWSSIASAVLSVLMVSGGIAFFVLLKSVSIGSAIAYVGIKFLLMSSARLIVSYISILVVVVGLDCELYGIAAGGACGLVGIAMFLAGMEMMVDSFFNF